MPSEVPNIDTPEPHDSCPMFVGAWGVNHVANCAWVKWNHARLAAKQDGALDKQNKTSARATDTNPLGIISRHGTKPGHEGYTCHGSANAPLYFMEGEKYHPTLLWFCTDITCDATWHEGCRGTDQCHALNAKPCTIDGVDYWCKSAHNVGKPDLTKQRKP